MGNVSREEAEEYLRYRYGRDPSEEEISKYYNYMNKD